MGECTTTDRSDRIGDDDADETGAKFKCIFTNRSDRTGNGDVDEMASIECIFTNSLSP